MFKPIGKNETEKRQALLQFTLKSISNFGKPNIEERKSGTFIRQNIKSGL